MAAVRIIYARRPRVHQVQLRPRDQQLLAELHRFGGLMTYEQLYARYWQPTRWNRRSAKRRLAQLVAGGFLQRRQTPDFMLYWLGRKGAVCVADTQGQPLQGQGRLVWLQTPPLTLKHDLEAGAFHAALADACRIAPDTQLVTEILDQEMRRYPQQVYCTDIDGASYTRRVAPDRYFEIEQGGRVYKFAVEIDMGTRRGDANILRLKLIPAMAYIHSNAFRLAFGGKPARWLWLTTSKERLANLKAKIERVGGEDAHNILMTTYKQAQTRALLTEPIWYQGTRSEPVSLFES